MYERKSTVGATPSDVSSALANSSCSCERVRTSFSDFPLKRGGEGEAEEREVKIVATSGEGEA